MQSQPWQRKMNFLTIITPTPIYAFVSLLWNCISCICISLLSLITKLIYIPTLSLKLKHIFQVFMWFKSFKTTNKTATSNISSHNIMWRQSKRILQDGYSNCQPLNITLHCQKWPKIIFLLTKLHYTTNKNNIVIW